MLRIFGSSDDLVELEGDIHEEFNFPYNHEGPAFLALSDGTLLSIEYGDEGIWRIHQKRKGAAIMSKVEGVDSDSDNYSDVVTIDGSGSWGKIEWALFGTQWTSA